MTDQEEKQNTLGELYKALLVTMETFAEAHKNKVVGVNVFAPKTDEQGVYNFTVEIKTK